MIISELLRKLFNLPEPTCQACPTLREEIYRLTEHNRELTNAIIEAIRPKTEEPVPVESNQKQSITRTRFMPISTKLRELEAQSFKEAQINKDLKTKLDSVPVKSIDELEAEFNKTKDKEDDNPPVTDSNRIAVS